MSGKGAGRADPDGVPRISIVITTYQYGRCVGAAIRSALEQTRPAAEVVVVDDGSTDDTREVMASFGDRIVAIRQPNRGQAAALNAGLARATGDLVALLDADDLLEPEALDRFAAAWRPGVARIQARVSLEADGEVAGVLPAGPLSDGDVRGLILESGGYPSTGTTGGALARQALEALLPIPEAEWRRNPDSYLMLLAPFTGGLAAVDAVVGRVRVHDANKWSALEVGPDRLRDYLECDRQKEALLRARAQELGSGPPADWLVRSTAHLQARLALLRLAPAASPFPGDSRVRLALRGARSALANRGFGVRKRLLMAAWFLLVGLLPRGPAAALARAGFSRARRPAWAAALLGGRRGGNERSGARPAKAAAGRE